MKKELQKGNRFCEIKVRDKLERRWAEWFDLMNVETESDATVISGFVTDQAALQGLMQKISTLGLTVISIKFGDVNGINYEDLS